MTPPALLIINRVATRRRTSLRYGLRANERRRLVGSSARPLVRSSGLRAGGRAQASELGGALAGGAMRDNYNCANLRDRPTIRPRALACKRRECRAACCTCCRRGQFVLRPICLTKAPSGRCAHASPPLRPLCAPLTIGDLWRSLARQSSKAQKAPFGRWRCRAVAASRNAGPKSRSPGS